MRSSSAPMQRLAGGRYVVYEALAGGGMATLHYGRMRGAGPFSRMVAVKKLRAEHVADPELVATLVDEARLASRVRHTNVVSVLDVVVETQTVPREVFVVLEYVHGESLATLLDSARALCSAIPPRVVVGVLSAVLHGLHAAHEATDEQGGALGLVHRDVSPHNILVGADGVARVVDFGIAKAAGRLQATREGQVKGKLAYMAPEQLTFAPVSRQTDVYAASVCGWEMLTGERLFGGAHESAVVASILNAAVATPSQRRASVPAELDTIVMRGLSRKATRRYATAREMALALEACIEPASPSEIAAWVEACAGPELARRSERIAVIERGNAEPESAHTERGEVAVVPDAAGAAPPTRRSPTSRRLANAAAGAAVALVAAFALLSRRGPTTSGTDTKGTLPSAALPVDAPPAAVAASAGPVSPSAEPSAEPASGPPASLAATPESPPVPPHHDGPARLPPSLARGHRRSSGGCDPSYVIDGEGHKIYKPACFP